MPWLQSPFSSSSTSSPASSKSRDVASIFSSRSSRSLRQRRLTRTRKLRYLADNDVGLQPPLSPSELSRSSCSYETSFSSGPQPLPLPELAMLLRQDAPFPSRDSHFGLVNVPLPSPKREKADGLKREAKGDGVPSITRFRSVTVSKDVRRGSEPTVTVQRQKELAEANKKSTKPSEAVERNYRAAESRSSKKLAVELNDMERNFRLNIPVSAPTSPFSSPALSPPRSIGDPCPSHCPTPHVFQVWSAPEMSPSDDTLGVGFQYQMSHEIMSHSVENSPLHSSTLGPYHNILNPSRPSSPMNNRISVDSTVQRESNVQVNVHPLPLPPGAALSSQSVPAQLAAKQELKPMKFQWKKGKLIGRGTFGSVYVASNRETGALCAMKEVELLPDDPKVAESIRQLEQEIKVLSQLKHPNIVQYYGSEVVDNRLYIYLEYVHPGSINKYIRDHSGAITESVVRNFTRHILCGLAYLHGTKTIHRDIKGANLLVDACGVVKLADFGMAKHLTGHAAHLSLRGSPYWMAPELLQSDIEKDNSSSVALAVDIWSLGCTIIEMLNGKPPWSEYEGPAALFRVMRETPTIPETLSPEGKDFLQCCFHRNPAERPSASMLLEHQFLRSNSQQQQDVKSCTQLLNGLKLTEKVNTSQGNANHKLEQLVFSDAQTTIKKLAHNSSFIRDSFSPVRMTNFMKLPI